MSGEKIIVIVSPLPLVGAHTKIFPKYWKSTFVAANNDLFTKIVQKHICWHSDITVLWMTAALWVNMHEEKPVIPLADGQLTINVGHDVAHWFLSPNL